ncbi:hypothetical protein GCM10010206_79390 [Streptomyces cinerochromogenes]|nr:hypothetical protein GCM10010206_79390 [Streptomyces cinerochromogenes]
MRDIALDLVYKRSFARESAERLLEVDDDDSRFERLQSAAGLSVDWVYAATGVPAKAVDDFAVTASAALNDDGTKGPRFLRAWRGVA